VLKQIDRELTKQTEWTLFDDRNVQHIAGNWKEIVNDCVTSRHQPTVILYEKFDEEDIEFCKQPDDRNFEFDRYKVRELL